MEINILFTSAGRRVELLRVFRNAAAGCDGPRWLLAQAAGIPIDIPPLGSYEVGLSMTRFDESIFLTKKDYEKIAGSIVRS